MATPSPKDWYSCDIPREELRGFMERADLPGILHVGSWLLLLAGAGLLSAALFRAESLWAIPAFLLYGLLWSMSKPVSHESGHGTVFKTPWLNSALYFLAAAMEQKETVMNRWQHARHHSLTCMVGSDYEIIAPKPPKLVGNLVDFLYLKSGLTLLGHHLLRSFGIVLKRDRDLVPPDELPAVIWGSRAVLLLHLVPIAIAVATRDWLPVLLFVLPQFYGSVVQYAFSMAQHPGLQYDVWDHRLCARTVLMNPVFDWMTLHMQYHVEHHIYPTVPFWQLRRLHLRVRAQLPTPYRGLRRVFAELLPELFRERRDPTSAILRPLPPAGSRAAQPAAASSSTAAPATIPSGGAQAAPGTFAQPEPRGPLAPVAVCDSAALREGGVVDLEVGGRSYAVFRLPQGLYATDGLCTHEGACLADGLVLEGGLIECPRHNARFEIASGKAVRKPGKVDLRTWRAYEEGGKVWIEVPSGDPARSSRLPPLD